jgi:hypothetical protein
MVRLRRINRNKRERLISLGERARSRGRALAAIVLYQQVTSCTRSGRILVQDNCCCLLLRRWLLLSMVIRLVQDERANQILFHYVEFCEVGFPWSPILYKIGANPGTRWRQSSVMPAFCDFLLGMALSCARIGLFLVQDTGRCLLEPIEQRQQCSVWRGIMILYQDSYSPGTRLDVFLNGGLRHAAAA